MKLKTEEPFLTPRLRVIARLKDSVPAPEHYGPAELARDSLGVAVMALLFVWLVVLSGGWGDGPRKEPPTTEVRP